MSDDGVLSQEEIDALLRSEAVSQMMDGSDSKENSGVSAKNAANAELSDIEKDAVGEVGNMVMGSAATALSMLLERRVEITAPKVELTDAESFKHDYPMPYVMVNVEYTAGLGGANVLLIKQEDALIMSDLLMGNDGQSPPEEFGEVEISAINEAMNQMMGSAASAMATIISDRVEISPPKLEVVNFAIDEFKGVIANKEQPLVKVLFSLKVEDSIDSELIQLIPLDLAKNMVKHLIDEIQASSEDKEDQPSDKASRGAVEDDLQSALEQFLQDQGQADSLSESGRSAGAGSGVPVQPVQFTPLKPQQQPKEIGNIDIIMDVPLQITVELGRTKKTIREILSLGPGSIVELDKLAGEPVDLLVNGKLLAKGEVVVIDENFGIRVTDIISPMERVANIQ